MSISSFSHQYCVLKTNSDGVQSAPCGQIGLNGNPTGANSKARESGRNRGEAGEKWLTISSSTSGYVLEGSINYVIYRGGRGRKF
jgi:hypothetical protein